MFNHWWMHCSIADSGLVLNGVDHRVIIKERSEFTTTFFNIALISNEKGQWLQNRFIENKKGLLTPKLTLPIKTEEENFNDIRNAIISYKQLFKIFISIGIVDEPLTDESNYNIDLILFDYENRANVLEFFLLNNTNIPKPNQRTYYDGRLELDLIKLIQEMFFAAKYQNFKECQWMLSFNSPYEIWFILQCQISFIMHCYTYQYKPTNKQILDYAKHHVDNVHENLKYTYDSLQNQELLSITEAIKYTVAKLHIEHKASAIVHLYTNYLESIRLQAYKIRKNQARAIPL